MSISTVLFYIVALDALMVLGMGIVSAYLMLTGKDADVFWKRVWPATLMIIGTSFASGVILWIGDYMFVS